jgi:hypothetical protein
MRNNSIRGEWAGCSHLKEKRNELLKAHQEFVDMLANGWHVDDVKVKHKRPRIKREKFKVIITCFGSMKITIEEYNQYCRDFKTV